VGRRQGRRERRGAEERADRPLPDFTRLPERVAPDQLVTTQEVEAAPDPRGGRDTETEFLLRNAGF
jgi:hypothetical protein